MPESVHDPKAAFLAFLAEGHFSPHPDRALVARLQAIAASWSKVSQHFYAGYALWRAMDFAWGEADALETCALGASREFEFAAVTNPNANELEVAAALRMWALEVGMNYRDVDPTRVRAEVGALQEELAERLIHIADSTDDPRARAGFLVRGFQLETDFGGTWRPEFPEVEIDSGGMMILPASVVLMMPSAFRLFVRGGDYVAADSVARSCPEAFTSHGPRGWRAAVSGYLEPEQAVERFTEAAEELSQDTYEEAAGRAGGWSSVNIDLWAKYFQARAALAQIVRTPGRVAALLNQAKDAVHSTESGWRNPQVTCFRILIGGLEEIVDGNDPVDAAVRAREALFNEASRVGFDENDRLAVEFLDAAASAFAEIRDTPERGYVSGRLSEALKILGRIPLVGGDAIVSAIKPAVGERALATQVLGQHHTWIYRTIEGIMDEIALQKLLLRLMQAQLPLYAQRRHGPIEYGKDIVALVEVDGEHILQMYQVKAGGITKSNWAKARDELAEMFQVDMSSIQLPVKPDRREGILVFNGHINPYVEPVVEGWIKEQEDDHHRSYRTMHLDSIVRWIAEDNLVNELRQALAELGIGIDAI
jgi:hypothetical protein